MKRLAAAAAGAAAFAAGPAFAHHPLAGMPMETFAHGLLSGVGHPVLGFDHLFFVVAVGVAALFTANRLAAPAAYVAAMLAGCAFSSAGLALPLAEPAVALSLLALGGVLLSGRAPGAAVLLALFAGFGLFHGSAFGDAISGQEGGAGGPVLAGYLLGLGAVQYALALGAGLAARRLLGATAAGAVNVRLVGAAVSGVGAFLALELAEAPVVALIAAAA